MAKQRRTTLNPTVESPLEPSEAANLETIALLERWAVEDATEDPVAIAEAERELSAFKAALNANRPTDRPIFP